MITTMSLDKDLDRRLKDFIVSSKIDQEAGKKKHFGFCSFFKREIRIGFY